MKKVLSILLAVCLLVSFVPLTASATGTAVFTYDGNEYTTLNAAVAEIASGGSGTITMTTDVTYTDTMYGQSSFAMSVKDGKNVTLDLNGHTLTAPKSGFKVGTWSDTSGTLTIINGKLVFDGSVTPAADSYNYGLYVSGTSSVLNLGTSQNSGAYNETTKKGLTVTTSTAGTSNATGAYVIKGATINVYGKIENLGVDSAIMGDGNSTHDNINVKVYDGAVVTGGEAGIYFPNTSTLTVSGGTISGKTGIYVKSGTVNISGGTVQGTGAKVAYVHKGSGYAATGDALVVEDCDYPGGNPKVTVSGGTFTSTNAEAVKKYTNGTLNKTEGTFTITGGTFSSDPSEYVGGYTVVPNANRTYSVYDYSYVSEIEDVPSDVTGAYPNPSGTVFYLRNGYGEVEVTGELPYVSGRDDTPDGNYLWVRIKLDATKASNWTHVKVNCNDKIKEIKKWDLSQDANLDWHQKITTVGNNTQTIMLTFYNGETIVGAYPIKLDLTNATLESAPSNNGGSTGGSTTTPDEPETPDEDTPTTETTTSADGTTTTTTTWSDGKTSTSVKDPEGNVTTTVKSATGETVAEISLPAQPGEGKTFSDVNGWSKDAISKATGYGLFSGTTATTFAPKTGMTRAMVAQVLYNLSGKGDYGTDGSNYNDVTGSYANAINWATAAGVVSGNGNGTFEPNETVTREQLVTMLYNFAKAIGAVEKSSTGVENFPDGSKTSSWATDAMNWAIANGIISGSTNGGVTTLNPKDTATREQVASVMVKFVEMLTK